MIPQLHLGNMDMQILVIVLFMYRGRHSLLVAVGTLKLGGKDALAVRDYARAHPFEDADPSAISAEAGMPPSLDAEVSTPAASGEVTGSGGPASSAGSDSGMAQAEGSSSGPSNIPIERDDIGAEAKRLHFSGYGDNLPHGDVVPQTPVSFAGCAG